MPRLVAGSIALYPPTHLPAPSLPLGLHLFDPLLSALCKDTASRWLRIGPRQPTPSVMMDTSVVALFVLLAPPSSPRTSPPVLSLSPSQNRTPRRLPSPDQPQGATRGGAERPKSNTRPSRPKPQPQGPNQPHVAPLPLCRGPPPCYATDLGSIPHMTRSRRGSKQPFSRQRTAPAAPSGPALPRDTWPPRCQNHCFAPRRGTPGPRATPGPPKAALHAHWRAASAPAPRCPHCLPRPSMAPHTTSLGSFPTRARPGSRRHRMTDSPRPGAVVQGAGGGGGWRLPPGTRTQRHQHLAGKNRLVLLR